MLLFHSDIFTETFAIYQEPRVLDLRQESNRRHAIFSDAQPAIRCITPDEWGLGQQWTREATEVCTRLIARENRAMVHWAPADRGNEAADDLAK